MENDQLTATGAAKLTARQQRNRDAKAAQRIPNAVTALYELLKEFNAEERTRLIGSVDVLLKEPKA